MTKLKIFWVVLILASTCKVIAETPAIGPNTWEKLNLSSACIAGANVYYEKCLESNLSIFKKEHKKFLIEKDKIKEIFTKKEEIIADINRILGITELDTEKQYKILAELLNVFSVKNWTFYLVTKATIKDFLREGGQLPNCTYDKAADTVLYKPEFQITSNEGPLKDFEFVFPVASDDRFEKDVETVFQVLHEGFGSAIVEMAIHKVAEMTLVRRARPAIPYWRWFGDGVASAITTRILEKHLADEIAEEYTKGYDVKKYKELQKETNLRYWMALNFCTETPLKYENKLNMARYAYTTYEVEQLIEKHGLSCLKRY